MPRFLSPEKKYLIPRNKRRKNPNHGAQQGARANAGALPLCGSSWTLGRNHEYRATQPYIESGIRRPFTGAERISNALS